MVSAMSWTSLKKWSRATRACLTVMARKVLHGETKIGIDLQHRLHIEGMGQARCSRMQTAVLDEELPRDGLATEQLVDGDDFAGHLCVLVALKWYRDCPSEA